MTVALPPPAIVAHPDAHPVIETVAQAIHPALERIPVEVATFVGTIASTARRMFGRARPSR